VILASAAQGRFLLPVLATLAIYPMMASLLLRGRRAAALVAVLMWAASLSVAVITATRHDPVGMQGVVLNGPAYRDEMFAFIGSGAGRESDPERFLPQHLVHLGSFSLLAAATGGLLGIALGAILIGYMSYYVGALAAEGSAPFTALLLGWPPWAILRVVGFVIVGIVLAEPLLRAASHRLTGGSSAPRAPCRSWYVVAGLLLITDVLLKALLATAWAALLRPCLVP
jgi:hypothetical protein